MPHKCVLPKKGDWLQTYQCRVCKQLWTWTGFWAKIG